MEFFPGGCKKMPRRGGLVARRGQGGNVAGVVWTFADDQIMVGSTALFSIARILD
jgi:hypothetical protein